MRMYNLNDKTPNELKKLLDTVKSHTILTVEEKTANIEAIESRLNMFSKNRADVMADIMAGSADISDIGGSY